MNRMDRRGFLAWLGVSGLAATATVVFRDGLQAGQVEDSNFRLVANTKPSPGQCVHGKSNHCKADPGPTPSPSPSPAPSVSPSPDPTPTPSSTTGLWSDPDTWGGTVPGPNDLAVISGHSVTLDTDATVAGVIIQAGGSLVFDPGATHRLNSTGNVVVYGRLQMRPSDASKVHTIQFINVDEARFVGGDTMEPVNSDVGLWVVGAGVLDLAGTPKTAWTRNAATAAGWVSSDEIVVTPVARGDYTGFTSYTGATVPSNLPTWDVYTAEALNLTRNVVIRGQDSSHRAHVLVRNSSPVVHTISNVELRYLGPRKRNAEGFTDGVLGRYPLHFHMSMDNAGTVVDRCVVRDSGNHAFWPHSSDGITFSNCVAYNVYDDAFGWDLSDATNNIVWDSCVAALLRSDPVFRGYRLTGFLLGDGSGSVCRNCVATGVQGNVNASGYEWPEVDIHVSGIWDFHDNVAHNNSVDGIFTWQNTNEVHSIRNFTAFHNGQAGIEHGAYTNPYTYTAVTLVENGIDEVIDHASAVPPGLIFLNLTVDGRGTSQHGIKIFDITAGATTPLPALFLDCSVKGYQVAPILLDNSNGNATAFDFVHAKVGATSRDLTSADFAIKAIAPGTVIRVQSQDNRSAFKITSAGVASISPFWSP